MIKVNLKGNVIEVTGHAGFDESGKDIVCASVSSIIYTTVNGIFNIDQNAIKFTDNNDLIKIEIKNQNNIIDILIKNMIDLLENLEEQYPKNIKILKGE
jgi:hypothetical protein